MVGHLLFLLYRNDLCMIINNDSIPALFAADTSILFIHSYFIAYKNNIGTLFETSNKWFKGNPLSISLWQTHYTYCIIKNNMPLYMLIVYDNKTIPNVSHIKFLGITVDSTLSGRNHIEQLINNLNTASYVIHSVKSFMPHSTLIMIYYCLFHSVMTYGIIFWGNPSHSPTVFKVQNRGN